MIETENKINKQAEWTKLYTLTQEQTKELFLNKLRRAAEMQKALKKREMFLQKHRWSQSVL